MANIYGFDAYGTDLYTQQGGLLLPKEDYFTAKPREVINFTENQAQKQILKQYVKMNGDGLYEVKIPGRPTTIFYSEAEAINNCRNQLTNMHTNPQGIQKKPYVKPETTIKGGLTPEAQQALDNARRAEQAARFHGTSQEAMNRFHGIGKESDITRYFRELEAQQGNVTPPASQPASSPIYPHKDGDVYAKMLQEQAGKKPYVKPEITIQPSKKPYVKPEMIVTVQEPVIPEIQTVKPGKLSRADRLKAIRNDAAKRARYNKLKLAQKPELKARYDRMTHFKKMNGLKKGGKWIALGALVIGVGALLLKNCTGSKDKVAPTPTPETKPEETPITSEQPETPVAPTTPEEPAPTPEPVQKTGTFKAIPGSWEERFAQRELLLEHLGEADYKPTNAEISKRAEEIAARTGRTIDETGHSVKNKKWLQIGEEMVLSEKMAELTNQAREQLIEEHKDQKGYEPTWKEIRKIVDKKIEELQTEALSQAA